MKVAVQIPVALAQDAVILGSDLFNLRVTSYWDSTVRRQVSGTTLSRVNPAVLLAPTSPAKTGAPGIQVTYVITITNTGDYTDTFTLGSSGVWTSGLSQSSTGPLGAGKSMAVTLTVMIPGSAGNSSSDLTTVTATSALDATVSSSAQVTTTAIWRTLFLPMLAR